MAGKSSRRVPTAAPAAAKLVVVPSLGKDRTTVLSLRCEHGRGRAVVGWDEEHEESAAQLREGILAMHTQYGCECGDEILREMDGE